MRLIISLLFSFMPVMAFSCTSTGSGNWSNTGQWAACGGGVPHSGDTASIGNGHTITVTSAVTVGALTLVGSGTVTVTGGAFQVNGAITFDPKDYYCTVHNPVITLSAGTMLKFDSLGPSSGAACRSVVVNGTSASHVAIAARASSATIRLGGGISWTYADVSNISAFSVDEEYVNTPSQFKWDVTHSTFANVAPITQNGCCGVAPNGYFRHVWNVHTSSAGADIFHNWVENSGAALGSGTRDIVGNVFDKAFSAPFHFSPAYFTILGNYFADSAGWAASSPAPNNIWTRFDGNFLRMVTLNVPYMGAHGDLTNTLMLLDVDQNNPHVIGPWGAGGSMAMRDGVMDHAGSAGTVDSGEFFNASTTAGNTYTITNTLMPCNMYGTSSYEAGAWGISPITYGVMEHSMWCGGYNGTGVTGFPAYQMGEGHNAYAGQITSRSNIFWHPPDGISILPWYKLMEIGNKPNPTQDICAPAHCDYNTGYGLGYHATEPSWTAYTGQAKGYVAKFSSPPGVHDVDVDPQFVDYKRSIPLFYTKYLGNSPPAWSGGASYIVGNVVSYADTAIYYGLPVAYRYQNIRSCGGSNPQPGSGTNWRDCWEWATLKWVRDNVATNTLFDDPTIGVSQQDAIATVWSWIRAGYSPTNPLLAGAAHDGGDIGPIPVTFEVPGGGAATVTSSGTVRGARVKGSVIR